MKLIGYKYQEYQGVVHKCITNNLNKPYNGRRSRYTYTVLSPRQVGKTLLVENELLRFALNMNGSTSICLSPTLSQSRKVFKDLVKAVNKSKIIQSANASLLTIEFINGSEILFKSAEQREALRGYTVTGVLIIDEAAYIPDEVFNIIKPATNAKQAPIILTSTPRLKQGFFYENYLMGLSEDNQTYYSFNFSEYDLSRFLPQDLVEDYKKVMPRQQFQTEIKGEFLDTDGMLFSNIDDAIVSNFGAPTPKLFVGIDWSSGVEKDSTVLTILNENLEMVDFLRFNDKDTSSTIKIITNKIKEYKRESLYIYAESNGVGKPLCDLLKKELPTHNITPFTTTNKSKADQVALLQVALEQKQIKLINNKQLKIELSAYEAKYNTATGSISYNAPQGFNDDCVMSLMITLQCKKDKTMAGTIIKFS